ncbi:MAG: discoidin domain-containing protein, partial [Paludibacteraceae bacterium]|nr:discoidin domain-containing protein [Paludibacteraceae bacterium]
MRDAAIMGYTVEARATQEYWFDIDHENIDYEKFEWHPENNKKDFEGNQLYMHRHFNAHVKNSGIGWWTWFSGNPIWMPLINWLPMSPCLKYLYEFPEWNRVHYEYTEAQRELFYRSNAGSNPGFIDGEYEENNSYANGSHAVGNNILEYLQTFDPDQTAAIIDKMYYANMPISLPSEPNEIGGLTYYLTHSHRTWGDMRFDVYCDDPSSTAYYNKRTDKFCYAVYNAEDANKQMTFYDKNGNQEVTFVAPPHKLTIYCDEPILTKVEILNNQKTVETNSNTSLTAKGFDQYEVEMPISPIWTIVKGGGSISNTGIYTAPNSNVDEVVIGAKALDKNGNEIWGYDTLRVNALPIIQKINIIPNISILRKGATQPFTVEVTDQYNDPITYENLTWSMTGAGNISSDGIFEANKIGTAIITATIGNKSESIEIRVLPIEQNIALNKRVTSNSDVERRWQRITDNAFKDYWQCNLKDEGPWYVIIDLEDTYNVSEAIVYWQNAFATKYEFFISDDLTNWTSLYYEGLGMGDTTDDFFYGTGRYFKLVCYENAKKYCAAIHEVQVFGSKASGEPILSAIDITPDFETMNQDEQVKFNLIGYDQYNNEMTIEGPVIYSASIGEIDNDGNYTATDYGFTSISITYNDLSVKKDFYVNAKLCPDTVWVSPQVMGLVQEGTLQFSAMVKTKFGQVLEGYPITWSIDGNANDCTIDNNGLFTAGRTAGTYTIRATSGKATGTASVYISDFNNTNLATGKNAWASSIQYNTFNALKANDGFIGSRFSPKTNANEWWYVDLEDMYLIDRLVIRWMKTVVGKDFNIEFSADGREWQEIYRTTTQPTDLIFDDSEVDSNGHTVNQAIQTIDIDHIGARFVRINLNHAQGDYQSSFWEFEVYGEEFWNPVPTTMEIVPNNIEAYVNTDIKLIPIVYDQDGVRITGCDISWSVTDEGGIFLGENWFRPTKEGTFTITAMTGDIQTTATIVVKPEPVVTRIDIVPTILYAEKDNDYAFTATCYDQYDNVMPFEEPIWSVADGVTINQVGEIHTGNIDGQYRVSAKAGRVSGFAYVVIGDADSRMNLAVGKPTDSNSYRNYPPKNMTDNNINSNWSSYNSTGPVTIDIDLEDIYNLNEIQIVWGSLRTMASYYNIMVSTDGINYTTIVAAEEMDSHIDYELDKPRSIHYTSTLGRYIHIELTQRLYDSEYQIKEIRVFGEDVVIDVPARIEITPNRLDLDGGEVVNLTAKVYNGKGEVLENEPITWTFDYSNKCGTLTQDGVFTAGLISGSYSIVAESGLAIATCPVVITACELEAFSIGENQIVCPNAEITLEASIDTDLYSYQWTNATPTSDPHIAKLSAGNDGESTIVTLLMSDGNSCSGEATVTITADINQVPKIEILGDKEINCLVTKVDLTVSGGNSYKWSTGENSNTISIINSDRYFVTAFAENGCSSTASVSVSQNTTIPTVSITSSANELTCQNSIISLSANGADSYDWTNGEMVVTTPGTYTVIGYNANGCSSIESVTINENKEVVSVEILGNEILTCTKSVITLEASANYADAYRWSDNSMNQTVEVSAEGEQSVTVTYGVCSASASVNVAESNERPIVSIADTETELTCDRTSIVLQASGADSYDWQNGEMEVTTPGTYTVTGTNANGCSATASVEIT